MVHGRADEMLDSLGSLPVLPPLADELVALAISDHDDLERVLAVVERDPVLAAIVLRMVNSSAFALPHEVTELSRAVVLLGGGHVRSLALAAAMSALSTNPDAAAHFEHSFATACVARVVATAAAATWEETAFAAGILHDIGELVVVAIGIRPQRVAVGAAGRLAQEQEWLGVDHAELGAALARRWSIPAVLCGAIEDHHHPARPSRLPAHPTAGALAQIVAAAEAILDEVDGTAHTDGEEATASLSAFGIRDPGAVVHHGAETRDAHLDAIRPTFTGIG